MYLAGLSWKKAERLLSDGTIAVMPLGSIEEHGPIGPLGTDYLIPEESEREIYSEKLAYIQLAIFMLGGV